MLYFPHVVADDPIVNLEQKRGQTCSFSKKKKKNLFMRKEQCVLKLFTHTLLYRQNIQTNIYCSAVHACTYQVENLTAGPNQH